MRSVAALSSLLLAAACAELTPAEPPPDPPATPPVSARAVSVELERLLASAPTLEVAADPDRFPGCDFELTRHVPGGAELQAPE